MSGIGIQQRAYFMSRFPQANYATQTPFNTSAPYNFVRLLVTDRDLVNYKPNTQDNKEASTGSWFATENYITTHEATTGKKFHVSSDNIGRWLLFAMGSIATAQPDAGGNPLVYKHDYLPLDPDVDLQPPAFTFGQRLGTGFDHLFPSVCVRSLKISSPSVNRLEGEVDLIGSGKMIDPSGAILAPNSSFNIPPFAAETFFAGSQLALTIADANTLANSLDICSALRVNNWSVNITRKLAEDGGYRQCGAAYQVANDPDSGSVRQECLQTDFDVIIEQEVRVKPNSEEYTYLRTQRRLDWKAELTGKAISGSYKHKLTLNSKFSSYSAVEVQPVDELAVFKVTVKQLYDSATGNSFAASLINTTASYTA